MKVLPKCIPGVFQRPPDSGVWWINYYDTDGKRHRERIGRLEVALEAYSLRKREVHEGRFIKPRFSLSFKQIADQRMEYKKLRLAPRSYRTDELRLPFLVKELGTSPAARISPERIEQVLARIIDEGITGKRPVKGPTANRYRSLLSSIFSLAVERNQISKNPVARVKRFKESEERIRYLREEEESSIREVIRRDNPDREAEFDLALYTGIRRGEKFSLKWEDVDLERSILTVRGKGGRRHVQINSIAKSALEKLRCISNGSAYVCPGKEKSEQLDWSRWFEDAVTKAKILNFRFHDLRHTFASRMVMAGVNLRSVQQLLGHRSIVTTMRYAHLSPDHQQANVERIVRPIAGHQDGTDPQSTPAVGAQVLKFQCRGA
jgi:integrase